MENPTALRPIQSALAALLCASAAMAQVDISGTVTSKATGRKLAGAIITLSPSGLSDTTDANGAFRIGGATGIARSGGNAEGSFPEPAWRGGALVLRSDRRVDARADLMDPSGRVLAEAFRGILKAGENPLRGVSETPGIRFLVVTSEGRTARYTLAGMDGASGARRDPLRKGAAETLRVKRGGYKVFEKALAVNTGVQDAALEIDGIGCAAAPVCWDFESGQLPAGTRAAQLPGQPARGPLPKVDQLQAHGGKYAMHLDNLTGQPMRDIAYTLPANFGPILWGRMWVYITPGAPMPVAGRESSHGALFKGIYAPDRYWYELGFEKGKYLQIQHIPEPPGFPEWVLYVEKGPPNAKWECVEWEFDGRAPSEPRLFVDGEEIPVSSKIGWDNGFFQDKPANLYKPATDFNEFWLGLDMYHPIKDPTQLWFDDVAVAPVRIGCE